MITPNSLIIRYLRHAFLALMLFCLSHLSIRAEEQEPYAPHFNPATGFKPAQRSLTHVFLQMAGSLEHFGTPEPYIRHVMAEHARIDAKYKLATGKGGSSRPAYLTDEYIDNLLGGWNKIAPVLNFESLCKLSGRNMRHAILGGWNKSVSELVADENQLTESEKTAYKSFLKKDYFAKADFPDLEAFYKAPYDKLSEAGKEQLSQRTKRGALKPEQREQSIKNSNHGTIIISILNEHQKKTLASLEGKSAEKINSDNLKAALIEKLSLDEKDIAWQKLPSEERDALRYSHAITAVFQKRFAHVRKDAQTPEQAANIEKAMTSMVINLLTIAQSEFEAALDDDFIAKKHKQ